MKNDKMVTIELTSKAYRDLLWFKNFMSLKLNGITNDEVCKKLNINPNGVSYIDTKLEGKLMKEMDFEPEFTFSDCISSHIKSTMVEQKTGEVNFIT
jgi:orotate phosphoribosyltransferase-like protein